MKTATEVKYFILPTSNKDYYTTLEKNSKYLLSIGLN